MIVVLERGATPEQVAEVAVELERRGLEVRAVRSGGRPLIHVLRGGARQARHALRFDAVEGLVATSGPRIRREGHRFFPHHFIQWGAIGIVLLAVLTLLAGQMPPGLGPPPDVQRPPDDLPVPWYLRAPLAIGSLFPGELRWLGWLAVLAFLVLVLLVPRFDRGERGTGRGGRALATAIVVAALAFALVPSALEALR